MSEHLLDGGGGAGGDGMRKTGSGRDSIGRTKGPGLAKKPRGVMKEWPKVQIGREAEPTL